MLWKTGKNNGILGKSLLKMINKNNGLKNIHITIPKDVSYIINKLTSHGFEAYAVGGCVRDKILGREPEDWDITTSALPNEIKGLFRCTIDTGIKHGTVTVLLDKIPYEVTTYRIDGEYGDNRHPNKVEFTTNLLEDLKRRDFTINAMAYNEEEGFIDPYGGLGDLENKIIRCVGQPKERFSEDALRTLRAIRFSAQLGFLIEKETQKMISEMAYLIPNISKERIQVELDKILVSDYPGNIITVYETGLSSYILPEFDAMMTTPQNSIYHIYNVGEHTLAVLENIRNDHYLRWAAFLHDVGKPFTKIIDKDGRDHFYNHDKEGALLTAKILKNLRFDNKTVDIVTRLVKYHEYKRAKGEIEIRKNISAIGKDIYPLLIELYFADLSGKSEYAIEKVRPNLEYLKRTYEKIIRDKDPLSLKDLKVKGSDLIDIGVSPGKSIGRILDMLLNMVLENPDLNDRESLLKFVKKNLI